MIKHVFLGFLNGVRELDALRWYLRFHSKEVVRFVGPWLRRYETYKAYPPPPEGKRFGAVGGFYTELWYSSTDDFLEGGANDRPYTWAPFFRNAPPGSITAGVTMVSARPTEDLLGKEPAPQKKQILRWIRLLRYPDGVTVADGERWYLQSFAPETKTQVGLLRYISHRVEEPPIRTPWHRLEELWYDDFDAWWRAVVVAPLQYTPPPWHGEEPFMEMVSSFVDYQPTYDFLKENPVIP